MRVERGRFEAIAALQTCDQIVSKDIQFKQKQQQVVIQIAVKTTYLK